MYNPEKRFNYSKLRGRIKEKYGTDGNFANSIGLSNAGLSTMLKGLYPLKQTTIVKFCDALDIEKDEIGLYFFTQNS